MNKYSDFCKIIHSNLKSFINASISTKVFDNVLVIEIKRLGINYKKELDNVNNYISKGDEGIYEVLSMIEEDYSTYVYSKFFYKIDNDEVVEEHMEESNE